MPTLATITKVTTSFCKLDASLTRHFINRCFQICKLISCTEIVISSLCIPTSSLSKLIPKINGYSVPICKYPASKSFAFFLLFECRDDTRACLLFQYHHWSFFSALSPLQFATTAPSLPRLMVATSATPPAPIYPIYSNAAHGKSNASLPGVKTN